MWRRSNRKRQEFETAALEHLEMLYSVALRLTRDQQNAEDLVQDTYVRALRFYDRFEWGTNMRAWLLRILTNTFVNTYRKNQKHRKWFDQQEIGPAYELLSGEAATMLRDAESQAMAGLLRQELVTAVDELPEEFRVPLVLADAYGFSYKEIADIQDCPIGTVMSRLHRARKALQVRLLDHAMANGWVKAPRSSRTQEAEGNTADLEEYRLRRRRSS